jgi:hypothetical protein
MSELTVKTEKLQDFDPSELFAINTVSGSNVRRGNVAFEYTELEVLSIKSLIMDDILQMLSKPITAQAFDIIWCSIVNYRDRNIVVDVARSERRAFFIDLLEVYASLPYYIQPGFKEIVRYGFRLDNGFSLVLR